MNNEPPIELDYFAKQGAHLGVLIEELLQVMRDYCDLPVLKLDVVDCPFIDGVTYRRLVTEHIKILQSVVDAEMEVEAGQFMILVYTANSLLEDFEFITDMITMDHG